VKTPVVASDGRVYEESAFREFLEKNRESPVTRESITDVYYVSYDIKQIIDNLETIYPEIKNHRYEEDYTYTNNVAKIKRLISKKQFSSLLNYTQFNVRDMIKHGIIDTLISSRQPDVLIHIVKNSSDVDQDLLVLIICKSLPYKENNKFIKACLADTVSHFNHIEMGIIFNNACKLSRDMDLIIKIINYCYDIRSLMLRMDDKYWSHHLHSNKGLGSGYFPLIEAAYYKQLLTLAKLDPSLTISYDYFLNDSWNTLKMKDGNYEEAQGWEGEEEEVDYSEEPHEDNDNNDGNECEERSYNYEEESPRSDNDVIDVGQIISPEVIRISPKYLSSDEESSEVIPYILASKTPAKVSSGSRSISPIRSPRQIQRSRSNSPLGAMPLSRSPSRSPVARRTTKKMLSPSPGSKATKKVVAGKKVASRK